MKPKLIFSFILFSVTSFSQTKNNPLKHAWALKDSGLLKQAFREVNLLIAKDSTVADFFDFRGLVYIDLKSFDDALDDFTKAISLNPKNYYYYHHRADLYSRMLEPDKAIEDNDQVLKLVETDSLRYDFILNRGSYHQMKRDFQSAYQDYLSVLKFDSVNQGALTNMGTVLDELGKVDEAIFYLEKVVKLYPSFVGGYGNLAFLFMEKEDYRKALEYNNKVLELDGDQPLAYNNRGFVKYKLNDLKGAMEDVNHSIKLYPTNSYAYKNRALIFVALKQYNFACDDLKMAISLGFTEMYGDEVQKLLEKYCTKNN